MGHRRALHGAGIMWGPMSECSRCYRRAASREAFRTYSAASFDTALHLVVQLHDTLVHAQALGTIDGDVPRSYGDNELRDPPLLSVRRMME
jgi:hypothetical protein